VVAFAWHRLPRPGFGLMGTGHWARTVHGPSVAAHPGAELVGVWGRDQARTAALADELRTQAYAELDSLFELVDALTFAVPPDVQAPIATRAAERRLHLLLEKPIALSVARSEEHTSELQSLTNLLCRLLLEKQ